MALNILVLNTGSSSLKFEVIAEDGWKRIVRGGVDRLGESATVTIQPKGGEKRRIATPLSDAKVAVEFVLHEAIGKTHRIDAVGHRVVHGGEKFHEPVRITDEVMQDIRDCAELAPLHNVASIHGIEAVSDVFGARLPQVAVFDTAFHQTLPEHAYLYAIPYQLYTQHKVRRYGFHGISYRYLTGRYREITGKSEEQTRVIALHLGNGCSICAIDGGKSVDTSMGLTPLEGLVMGTRSGDLDPAVVEFLMRKEGKTVQQIDGILNSQSGLLGLSGLTNDMRDLLEKSEHGDERAALAIDAFCYRARKYIGSYLAAMGGADALIFSGGIGENNAEIRRRICQGLEWFGLELDNERNRAAAGKEGLITRDGSRLAVYVIATDEELMIARDTARLINPSTAGS
jgi:acetate kinase